MVKNKNIFHLVNSKCKEKMLKWVYLIKILIPKCVYLKRGEYALFIYLGLVMH
jgi:hypothetical protein